jgi:Protein of unknown function (DUF1592)/Protein of unknown function (DUF1588)/Protein of unknown function (DUF1585)/Protein of unknown function (DUF1587)/Protein of unknown function (DUF1595)
MRSPAGMMILCLPVLVALTGTLPLRAADPAKPRPDVEKVSFARQVAPILAHYCTSCHGGEKPKGQLALDLYKDEDAAFKNLDIWPRVAERLHNREMPPAKRPQPTDAERELLTRWVDAALGVEDCVRKKDPGRVTLRRLNRSEYNNTIRDLVGVRFQPADDFPADDVGYGFDNIGDVLTVPPLLLEKYLAAAEKIVAEVMATPDLRKRIFIVTPPAGKDDKARQERDACARKIIEDFGRHAYRRPLFPGEVERLASFVHLAESQGDGFDKGIELALEAMLTSPHFLFRVERDPRPNGKGEISLLISNFELASRLSYFLWSTMPDEELLKQAKDGTLRKNLEAQVKRMMKDPRAHALVENFAGQWLQLRNLKNASPDPARYPAFDESLRAAMQKETELFFQAILKEDRSVLDFLDADFTFVNERLARHYGIPGVKGEAFQRVKLTGGRRGGVLTQASVLTVTSNPTRTSPVKRGKWILENILGTPPPPPPANVPELSEDKKIVEAASLRKRMEQHRANPNCATCHERMDPLGFGFENFDAVGAWRDRDGNFPIDPSGVLPGGQSFKGPAELKAILTSRRDEFSRCLIEKMLTYAVGRGMEAFDKCTIDKIAESLARNNYRFSALVIEIVKSDPFEMRRGHTVSRNPDDKPPPKGDPKVQPKGNK